MKANPTTAPVNFRLANMVCLLALADRHGLVLISNYHIRERSANPLPFANQIVVMETVLVVEDEVLIWSSISEYLRRCSYRVLEAADADEALIVLQKPSLKVDVLLSDIEMLGTMNGFELAKRARELRPGRIQRPAASSDT